MKKTYNLTPTIYETQILKFSIIFLSTTSLTPEQHQGRLQNTVRLCMMTLIDKHVKKGSPHYM